MALQENKLDYFSILGVSKISTAQEIKRSFRRLAMKYHPDKNPGNVEVEEKFRLITEAYQILSDPDKRAQWEASLVTSSELTVDHSWDDLVLRRKRQQHVKQVGADVVVDLKVSFADVFDTQQKVRHVTFSRQEKCEDCGGSGFHTQQSLCKHCQGTGQMRIQKSSAAGTYTVSEPCEHCQGTGHEIFTCDSCAGKGTIEVKRELDFPLSKEIFEQSPISLANEGNWGIDGSGCLMFNLNLSDDEGFSWDSERGIIKMSYELPFPLFILGGNYKVNTSLGTCHVLLPENVGSFFKTTVSLSNCVVPVELTCYPKFPRKEQLAKEQIASLQSLVSGNLELGEIQKCKIF